MNHLTEKDLHYRAWRLRLVISLAVLLLAAEIVAAQSASMSPRAWEASLVIPTYELGPPNPYPALLDWHGASGGPSIPTRFWMH